MEEFFEEEESTDFEVHRGREIDESGIDDVNGLFDESSVLDLLNFRGREGLGFEDFVDLDGFLFDFDFGFEHEGYGDV